MNDKFIYAGIFTPIIKGTLSKEAPNQHITLAFKPDEIKINEILQHFNDSIEIEIIGYGNDGKNEGLLTKIPDNIPYFGAQNIHITLSTSEDSTPVKTGSLSFDKEIPKHIPKKITGTIGAFTAKKGVVFDKEYIKSNCIEEKRRFLACYKDGTIRSININEQNIENAYYDIERKKIINIYCPSEEDKSRIEKLVAEHNSTANKESYDDYMYDLWNAANDANMCLDEYELEEYYGRYIPKISLNLTYDESIYDENYKKGFIIGKNGVLTEYFGKDKNPVLPDGTIIVGESVFENLDIESIAFPDSVTHIGYYACRNCQNLKNVYFGKNLQEIYASSFYNSPVENVYIKDIDNWCNINLGNESSNPLKYGANLYLNNKLFTEFIATKDTTELKDFIFNGCKSIKNADLSNINKLGMRVFGNCFNLQRVSLSQKDMTFGEATFYNCTGMKDVNIANLDNWLSYSFNDAFANPLHNSNAALLINDELVSDINISSNISEIKNYAFINYKFASSLKLSNTVEKIGQRSFEGCKFYTKVELPSSLKEKHTNSFDSDIKFKTNNITLSKDGALEFKNKESFTLACEDYLTIEGNLSPFFNKYDVRQIILPLDVKIIPKGCFKDYKNLEKVIAPGVRSVREYAFAGCDKLKEVVFSDELRASDVWNKTFYYCKSLEYFYPEIDIDECWYKDGFEKSGLRENNYFIKNDCLIKKNNGELIEYRGTSDILNVPKEVKQIGERVLTNSMFKYINVEQGNPIFISVDGVLFDKTKETLVKYPSEKQDINYDIPVGTKVLGKYAFYSPENLENTNIPITLEKIETHSFYNCASLKNADIPENVSIIESNAYYNCPNMATATIRGTNTDFGHTIFSYDSGSRRELRRIALASEEARDKFISHNYPTKRQKVVVDETINSNYYKIKEENMVFTNINIEIDISNEDNLDEKALYKLQTECDAVMTSNDKMVYDIVDTKTNHSR